MKRNTLLALMAAGVFLSPPATSGEMSLDVSPIRVQVNLKSGSEHTNAVKVFNSGDEAVRLNVHVEDWYLDEGGTPIYRKAGTVPRTASLWVSSAPSDFLLEPGETEIVRYTIQVPAGMPDGGYQGTLILETLPLDRADVGKKQMFVQGRIACVLYVSVGNPSRSAQIIAFHTVERNGRRFLRMEVQNTGEDFIRLAGDVVCLEGGRELPESLEIPDVPVFPGAKRWLELELPQEDFITGSLARATIDIDGVGVLMGECYIDPEDSQLADR